MIKIHDWIGDGSSPISFKTTVLATFNKENYKIIIQFSDVGTQVIYRENLPDIWKRTMDQMYVLHQEENCLYLVHRYKPTT